MRLRGLSAKISSKALASIAFRKFSDRVFVAYRGRRDTVLERTIKLWAIEDFYAELIFEVSSNGHTSWGFQFPKCACPSEQSVAMEFCCRMHEYQQLGEYLIQQGWKEIS